MAEVRIIDYAEIEKGREADKIVYDKMAAGIVSELGDRTRLSDEMEAAGRQPFKGYCVQLSRDEVLVSIGSRFQDPNSRLSGLAVDVTLHREDLLKKVMGPVMHASKMFRQVEEINLIQKYKRND